MRKHLAIAAGIAGILALAAGGVAVNAATLSAVPTSRLGNVPAVLTDDRGGNRTASPTPTPSASASTEAGDDGLPRHSGQDDGAGHDVGDDHGGLSGSDDGAGHDVGDDHGGATTAPAPTSGSGSSGSGSSGSGSSGSGSGSSGSGSSGGGHGSDDGGSDHSGSGHGGGRDD